MSTLTVDLGPAGDSLEMGLLDRLELSADEQRWVDAELAALDAQAGPPPF